VGDGSFKALDADGALFQRSLHAGTQLVFVERLAAAVLLDQPWKYQFSGLERGEALAAGDAFTATADLIALRNKA
jgi:hypothetical protein